MIYELSTILLTLVSGGLYYKVLVLRDRARKEHASKIQLNDHYAGLYHQEQQRTQLAKSKLEKIRELIQS